MMDPPVRNEPRVVPREINRWNWGAFLLNWIWGVGNNTFVALLTLVPFLGWIMPFVLGAKGSAWAWQNGRWDSIEHFKRVQRLWAIWGLVIWIVMIGAFGGVIGGVFYLLGHSEAYTLAVSRLQGSTEAASLLGTPISTGTPFGSINVTPTSGRATLSFSATGTKATGTVFVDALKKDGIWSLTGLSLKVEGSGAVIDLLRGTRADDEYLPGRTAGTTTQGAAFHAPLHAVSRLM
jgi:Cytochrome oxidase complex assembly protein 1